MKATSKKRKENRLTISDLKSSSSSLLGNLIDTDNNFIFKCIKFILFGLDTTDINNIADGTVIKDILDVFDEKTDIPLEIPFICFLTVWSGYLNQKEVKVQYGSTTLYPDIWTVLLAESGSGKTFTLKQVSSLVKANRLSTFGTSASFIQSLAAIEKGYIVKDEFAEFLKQLETQTYMQELKEYLLQVYSNETIVRQTKNEEIVVENPVLSVLGTTVKKAFLEVIKPIWLIDGFLQRFSILLSNKPSKNVLDYIIYEVDLSPVVDKIQRLQRQIKKEYVLGNIFEKVIRTAFKSDLLDLDNSFIRRTIFKVAKYSLLFHVLIDPSDDNICLDAILKACLLGRRHIADLKEILNEFGLSDLEKKVRAVENLKKKLGKTPTARQIIQHVYSIKTAAEANAICKIVGD